MNLKWWNVVMVLVALICSELVELRGADAVAADKEKIRQLIKDIKTRRATIELVEIGAPAVPFLIEALRDLDRRAQAAETLGEIGPAAKAALPHLTKMLDDPSCEGSAAEGLGGLRAEARPAVKRLIAGLEKCMGDTDKGSLDAAFARALGKIGDPAALPVLIRALEKKNYGSALQQGLNESLREAAAEALGRIGDVRCIPELEKAYRDDSWMLRSAVISGLKAFDDGAVIPLLVNALGDSSTATRGRANLYLFLKGDKLGASEFNRRVMGAAQTAPTKVKELVPDLLRQCGVEPPATIRSDLGLPARESLKIRWQRKFPPMSVRDILFDSRETLYAAASGVVKFSEEGRELWATGGVLRVSSVALDEGGVYAVGYSEGDKIVKYGLDKKLLWGVDLNEHIQENGRLWERLSVDREGNLHLVGTLGSPGDYRVIRVHVKGGGKEVRVVKGAKANEAGPFGVPRLALGISRVLTTDGSGRVCGVFRRGYSEYVVVCFGASGELEYSAPCNGFGDLGPQILCKSGGETLVGGADDGSGGKLVKLNALGREEWSTKFENGEIRAVCMSQRGEVLVARNRWPSGTGGVIAKVSMDGKVLWEKEIDFECGSQGTGFIKDMDMSAGGLVGVLVEFEAILSGSREGRTVPTVHFGGSVVNVYSL